MLKGKKISTFQDLKDFLIQYCKEKNAHIYLFGSRAKDESSVYSDIDIGIDPTSDNIDFSYLRFLLEESNLPQKVDLIDMRKVSPEFREEIEKTGEKWL